MTNDDYYDRSEYSQITWEEVRKGDVLLHEDGDRLTVGGVDYSGYQAFRVAGAWHHEATLKGFGFFPYRRNPEMPTQPGAYADKRGVHWLLNIEGGWCESGFGWQAAEEAAEFAPFTRLVPMPTEEELTDAVDRDPELSWMGRGNCKSVATTVLAFLGGGDDD